MPEPIVGGTDRLTGLGDRASIVGQLQAGSAGAVVIVDLDDFRAVNEALGHRAGDQTLIDVADRLRTLSTEFGAVCRLGDDEFALVVPAEIDPLDWAERIRDMMRVPMMVGGQPHTVLASVGVASAEDMPADVMLQAADGAVARAKERGGDRVEVCEPVMLEQAVRRHDIERGLWRAIEAREIRVHYQPKVSMTTGLICGAEALARWERPGHGLIYPDGFIEIAERSGLIKQIGSEVLRQACIDGVAILRDLKSDRPFTMSVNVSTAQLHDPGFLAMVTAILQSTGLPAWNLCLEVTESAVLAKSLRTERLISSIRAMGITMSIDDFGTGYSSLSHLRRLPVNELKIDRSFIVAMADEKGRKIVRAICDIAEALELQTVAEGVEDDETIASLRGLGCDIIQGYVYFRPAPFDKIHRAIRKDRPRRLPDPIPLG